MNFKNKKSINDESYSEGSNLFKTLINALHKKHVRLLGVYEKSFKKIKIQK